MSETILTDERETPVIETHEIMKWLDDTARDRFVKFQALFESPGWPLFREWAIYRANEALIQGSDAQTWEGTNQWRGRREAWSQVAEAANTFMNEFRVAAEMLREDSVVEAEDVPE